VRFLPQSFGNHPAHVVFIFDQKQPHTR
jgi:hypothetical protein